MYHIILILRPSLFNKLVIRDKRQIMDQKWQRQKQQQQQNVYLRIAEKKCIILRKKMFEK